MYMTDTRSTQGVQKVFGMSSAVYLSQNDTSEHLERVLGQNTANGDTFGSLTDRLYAYYMINEASACIAPLSRRMSVTLG